MLRELDGAQKGQALVTLESQEVGEAKSEFYKTKADLELAEINHAREKRLSESGIGIQKNLLAAEMEHKIAQSNAEAAHKKLHVLGFNEEQVLEISEAHQSVSGEVNRNSANSASNRVCSFCCCGSGWRGMR